MAKGWYTMVRSESSVPAVLFAMRYPSDIGMVWRAQGEIYDMVAGYLRSHVRCLVAYPKLSNNPAFQPSNLEPIACNLYDTSASNREQISTVFRTRSVRLLFFTSCTPQEVDLSFFRSLGVKTWNYEFDSYATDPQPIHKTLLKKLMRTVLRRNIHDFYVANTVHQSRFLVRVAGLPANRVQAVVTGVNVDHFCPGPPPDPQPLGLSTQTHYVVSVSQARPEKRLDRVIDAALILQQKRPDLNVSFVHVGDGPSLSDWQNRVSKLGLEHRFHFVGNRRDVLNYLRLATVFIHVAERESFGFAVAEAMAVGKPVLVTKSAGPCEIIEPGVNGILVDPNDIPQLATNIARILDNPTERERLGRAARDRIVEHFNIRNHARGVSELIATHLQLH